MIIVGFFLMLLLGFLFINLFLFKESLIEKVILGYGFGLGFSGFLFFLMGAIKIPLTWEFTLLSLFFFAVILFFLNLKLKRLSFKFKKAMPHLTVFEKFGFVFLIFLFGWIILVSSYWPIHSWDSLTLYDFRGKVFSQEQSLNLVETNGDVEMRRYLLSYPLNLSLLHAFSYLLGGANPQFIYGGFYVVLVLAFLINARKATTSPLGLLLTLILATVPIMIDQGVVAYPNVPYAYYYFLAVIFFMNFVNKNQASFLLLGCLSLGFAVAIRPSEPFWVVPLFFLLPVIFKKKRIIIFLFSLSIFILMRQVWFWYRDSVFSWKEVIFLLTYNLDFPRIEKVFQFLSNSLFGNYLASFILFLTSFINLFKRIKTLWFILGITVTNLIVLVAGTYFLSFTYSGWQAIADSVVRVSILFIPLFLYSCFLAFKP